MTFEFDKAALTAFDPDTGVKIYHSKKRYEILGIFVLVYSNGNLSFDFFTFPIFKNIKTKIDGGMKETRRDVARYIDLSSLVNGLNTALRALGRPPLAPDEYSRFLTTVKEGVIAEATWGGWTLEQIPDFRVDFVNSREELDQVMGAGEERMR